MNTQKDKSVKELLGIEELTPMESGEIEGGAAKEKCKCKCDCKGDTPDNDQEINVDI